MRARDLFGVAVRCFGIWNMTQAAYWAFYAAMKFNPTFGNPKIPQEEDMAIAMFYFALGLVLLILADPIVRAVYGAQIPSAMRTSEQDSGEPPA
ncbi:MAG: hypothetical protein P4L57_01960 [Rhizomicrobium sp.]|nr:hypothetical protein [Rhizomicrobium sp.]